MSSNSTNPTNMEAQAQTPPGPFQRLPTELRFQIYGYADLEVESPSLWLGLYLSCKQMKAEMDSECGRNFHKAITKYIPENGFIQWHSASHSASPFAFLRKLVLSFDSTRFESVVPTIAIFPYVEHQPHRRLIAPLLELHLDSLTIMFHTSSTQVTRTPTTGVNRINWLIANVIPHLNTYAKTRDIMPRPALFNAPKSIFEVTGNFSPPAVTRWLHTAEMLARKGWWDIKTEEMQRPRRYVTTCRRLKKDEGEVAKKQKPWNLWQGFLGWLDREGLDSKPFRSG
ncbi:hypothetical protein CC80DRAFT_550561 [Byssothecium circinans]|uniref:F-box domain-containing protein n=1 Tax=Byssothecium circinans TaxID=147558 RepID=A0A6A5TQ57_9PLEO|nr:hypothetical protein CC80DRAFT_550561 [Byssothecium circinans]